MLSMLTCGSTGAVGAPAWLVSPTWSPNALRKFAASVESVVPVPNGTAGNGVASGARRTRHTRPLGRLRDLGGRDGLV